MLKRKAPAPPKNARRALPLAPILTGVGTVIVATVIASLAAREFGQPSKEKALASLPEPSAPPVPSESGPPPGGGESSEGEVGPEWLTRILVGIGVILLVMVVGALAASGLRMLPSKPEWQVPGGDSRRGREIALRYGCGGCHTIGGIREANGKVGPELTNLSERGYLAGKLPNVPHYLVDWIRNPQQYEPGTAMPNLGVTEKDARDVADYLYTQQ